MIVSKLQSGLANRLKCVASSMRLDSDIEILWYKNVVPPYEKEEVKFTDYFVGLKECKPSELESKYHRECWRLFVFDYDLPENFSFIENQKLRYEYGVTFHPSVDRGKCIDFEYERIPENVRKEYIPIFQRIKSCVNPKINLIVENFSKNFDQNTVSVHIRTWCDSPERNSTYHSIDKYIEIMNEYPNNKFFVCSDSIETIDYLKNVFGEDRIITYSHVEENIDCFVELLLLSKNNFLIGSPISTFSEVAWWFSECKSTVKIAWK